MRNTAPALSKILKGLFNSDVSPIKANEFFVSTAYNSLAETLYNLFNSVDSARSVYNPATPACSAWIMTDNPSASADAGNQHHVQDTHFMFEDIFTDPDGHIKVTHVKRSSVTPETSPMRILYGPGDMSLYNPYLFAAVSVTAGQEQYLVAEYLLDEADGAKRFSSALEAVLEYNPGAEYADALEIFTGDIINETWADGTVVNRPVKFRIKFGINKTVGDIITAMNAFTYGGATVFRAALKVVSGGTAELTKPVIDMFVFYSDDPSPELLTRYKVLRFIPPMPSVRIASPASFFNTYFNVTSPSDEGNILAYRMHGGYKKFRNTGVYGFVLRREYDDAGMLTFPSQITIESTPVMMYVPNKDRAYHYTTSGAVPPAWFNAGSPLVNGFFSSLDMDMNTFFLPFVTVTESAAIFGNGFAIQIDAIGDRTIADISLPGSFTPALLESNVTYDINTLTSPYYSKMCRLFDVFKMSIGYSASDILTDTESALLRTAEFFTGLTWYLGNVVWIDPAIGSNPTDDKRELRLYRDLRSANQDGALAPGKIVIHIAGKTATASRTAVDAIRFDPSKRLLPDNLPKGLRHMVLDPVTTADLVPSDPAFTLKDAIPGRIVFRGVRAAVTAGTILDSQDFTVSDYVGLVLEHPEEYSPVLKALVLNCRMGRFQIEAELDPAGPFTDGMWDTSLMLSTDNVIEKFIHKGMIDAADFIDPVDKYGADYSWKAYLTGTLYSVHEISFTDPAGYTAVIKGRVGEVNAQIRRADPGSGDSDYPSCCGLEIPAALIQTVNASVSCLRILTGSAPQDAGCNCTFTPVFMPCALITGPDADEYIAKGYYDSVTVLESAGNHNTDLQIYFVFGGSGHLMASHYGEQRSRAWINSLIKVWGDQAGLRNVTFAIRDAETMWQPPLGAPIAWHEFDPDYFLASTVPANDFANTFMFIDCGLYEQVTVSGGTFTVNRGGRFLNTDMNIILDSSCATDINGGLRFFASRLFRRSPYLFYLADQHPVYSLYSRKRSENLRINFQLPHIEVGGYATAYPAPVVVRSEWSFDPVTGLGYPLTPAVEASVLPYLTEPNPFNWAGSKSIFAGVSGGSLKLAAMWIPPVQRQVIPVGQTPQTVIVPNTSINLGEDLSDFEIDIPKLDTRYPIYVEPIYIPIPLAKHMWVETQRGFNFLSLSNIYSPFLNRSVELKIPHWDTRTETSGIIGGIGLNVDISYVFNTQQLALSALEPTRADVGYLLGTAVKYYLPEKPWFHTVAVMSSRIKFVCSISYGSGTGVNDANWPLADIPGGYDLITRLENTTRSQLIPAFATRAAADSTRPMRFVTGGVIPQYKTPGTAAVFIEAASTGNSGVLHCSRWSIVLGGYNKFDGWCYQTNFGSGRPKPENEPMYTMTGDIEANNVSGILNYLLAATPFGIDYYANHLEVNPDVATRTEGVGELKVNRKHMITGLNTGILYVIPLATNGNISLNNFSVKTEL